MAQEDATNSKKTRSVNWWIVGPAMSLVTAWFIWWSIGKRSGDSEALPVLDAVPATPTLSKTDEEKIAVFCGDCHALPHPESFPRDKWHEKVRMGYHFYAQSGRVDLNPPPMHQTVTYYRSRAPKQLTFPTPDPVDEVFRSRFSIERLDWKNGAYVLPAISFLRWISIESDKPPVLLACDMRDGSVNSIDLRSPERHRTQLANLDFPCHAEPCDLNADGATDLVVAELGSFYPSDHDRGRIVWLRRSGPEEPFVPVTLADKMGRVSDVQPTDVDGDGDLDLIVAEFGNFRTGSIALMRNIADPGTAPRYEKEMIDPRPGTTQIQVHDFNHDDRPDFIALVSQEHECVEAFINRDDGHFLLRNLWAGPDLTFGSCSIDLADLDRDGDMDILYANGDSFDNAFANPSHGVQWLENQGDFNFAYHRLVDCPGAYKSLPADLDLDGDLDVIAVTFLPPSVMPENLRSDTVVSIILLEQVSPNKFISHTLETGVPQHATFEVGDFDNDGDTDFVVGTFVFSHGVQEPLGANSARLAIWWNQQVPNRN